MKAMVMYAKNSAFLAKYRNSLYAIQTAIATAKKMYGAYSMPHRRPASMLRQTQSGFASIVRLLGIMSDIDQSIVCLNVVHRYSLDILDFLEEDRAADAKMQDYGKQYDSLNSRTSCRPTVRSRANEKHPRTTTPAIHMS